MKIRTKCFLTVIITYLSMCVITWGATSLLMSSGADLPYAIRAAIVISVIFSSAGIKVGQQSKSVWISYIITVSSSWFTALVLNNLLGNVMPYTTWLNETINITSIVLGFPGFIYAMMLGEYYSVLSVLVISVIYILNGIVPVVVTVFSATRKN